MRRDDNFHSFYYTSLRTLILVHPICRLNWKKILESAKMAKLLENLIEMKISSFNNQEKYISQVRAFV